MTTIERTVKSFEDVISKQALYDALYKTFHDEDVPNNITKVNLGAIREFVKNFPSVTPQGCEGCRYEKTGSNSSYPCSHCSRCYTDKYKSESEE